MTPKLNNVADLVSCLMLGRWKFDMNTVAECYEVEMSRTGVRYSFELAEDYFYNAINSPDITESRIKELVELTMI